MYGKIFSYLKNYGLMNNKICTHSELTYIPKLGMSTGSRDLYYTKNVYLILMYLLPYDL